jgi:hypothetical protein
MEVKKQMKPYKATVKARLVAALALLAGGIGLSNAVWAGCTFEFDPFLTKATGLPSVSKWRGHPCAQPEPGVSMRTDTPGLTTIVTPEGQHPSLDPFENPPGSNFLMTDYQNLRDYENREMPNTLPSTPTNPYNLHDGPVVTAPIDPRSPDDDLDMIIDQIELATRDNNVDVSANLIQFGIDILEGNPIDRAYSGLAMLHYRGAVNITPVVPETDGSGNVIGGNADVNIFYWGQHIEADAFFIDPSAVLDVPWTVTYNVHILNKGMEDFSPMVSHSNVFKVPTGAEKTGPPHASMDQTFFPMLDEGTKYTLKIKQTKGKYFNLIYHWGWRIHPPRVQAIENARKAAGGLTYPQWEKAAFCEGGATDPDCDMKNNPDDKAYAIAQIGDLSPAKRMYNIFVDMMKERKGQNDDIKFGKELDGIAANLREAYYDWTDRTKLPTGVEPDPNATMTMFYVNNTFYGNRQGLQGEGSGQGPASYKGISNGSVPGWTTRPYNFKVTVLNGDHFDHYYRNVDFGGSRGWENQFQFTDPTSLIGPHPGSSDPDHLINNAPFNDHIANPTLAGHDNVFPINRGGTEEFLQTTPRDPIDPVNGTPQLGSGCFFTFGRNYLWPNAGALSGLIKVPAAAGDGTPGMHKVDITYNYEPSRRLRMYQFDPVHHGVAIYSLH